MRAAAAAAAGGLYAREEPSRRLRVYTFGVWRGWCRRPRSGTEQDASGSPRWRRWRRIYECVRACANSSSTHSCGVLRSAGEMSSFSGRTASIPRRLSISHCHTTACTRNVTYMVHNNTVIETWQRSVRRGNGRVRCRTRAAHVVAAVAGPALDGD